MNRAFIIEENGKEIIRRDFRNFNTDNIELQMFKFLKCMDEEKGILNLKKVQNFIKGYYGLSLSDVIDFFKDNKNWRLFEEKMIIKER